MFDELQRWWESGPLSSAADELRTAGFDIGSSVVTDTYGIPVDEELLEPLGLVMWAAVRLHHVIRDAICHIDGQWSDSPFDSTTGAALKKLRDCTSTTVQEPQRTALLDWIENVAKPAIESRNGVAHAIAFTAPDGRQALRGSKPDRPRRYLKDDLVAVARELESANARMPRGPCAV